MWAFFVGDFMTIQTVNLTVPGGDTPRSANTKINANFTDATHAASKLVGPNTGQIPLSEQTFKACFTKVSPLLTPANTSNLDFNTLESGTRNLVSGGALNSPIPNDTSKHWDTWTITSYYTSNTIQIAFPFNNSGAFTRTSEGVYKEWVPITTNSMTYATTTASGANVAVDATGKLMRSTSSEQYKNILAPLVLDDARYADAMALKPIVYRSTADADNPAYHYYSFSAEELGAYDPAFTLWRETETVTDEDNNVTEQPLAERQAEGININALLAMSHAIAIKQDKLIKKLEVRVAALEPQTNNP